MRSRAPTSNELHAVLTVLPAESADESPNATA
jgi:hypothetical protein